MESKKKPKRLLENMIIMDLVDYKPLLEKMITLLQNL